MFLIPQNLSQLDHLRKEKAIVFKEEVVDGVKVIIPHYMIGNNDLWKIPFARECRGHVYNAETGNLIGVALHKFFNVDEREETQKRNINWNNVSNFQEKIDGSMISVAMINDKIFFKTKKSFTSEVAVAFNKFFYSLENSYELTDEIHSLIKAGIYPIFEFYHPDWEIVLRYSDKPKFWITQFRDISGKYLDIHESVLERIPRKKEIDKSVDILELQNTATGIEGWIIHDQVNDEFYKLKTKDYLIKHRVRTEFRERDFAVLILEEKIDDVKSSIVESGYSLDKLEELERRVYNDFSSIVESVELVISECKLNSKCYTEDGPSYKEIALEYGKHPYFGMIMSIVRGKQPDYKEYFMKHILKQNYSLRCLYNENFSGE